MERSIAGRIHKKRWFKGTLISAGSHPLSPESANRGGILKYSIFCARTKGLAEKVLIAMMMMVGPKSVQNWRNSLLMRLLLLPMRTTLRVPSHVPKAMLRAVYAEAGDTPWRPKFPIKYDTASKRKFRASRALKISSVNVVQYPMRSLRLKMEIVTSISEVHMPVQEYKGRKGSPLATVKL